MPTALKMISAEDQASGDACCVISFGEICSQKDNPSQRRQRSSHIVFQGTSCVSSVSVFCDLVRTLNTRTIVVARHAMRRGTVESRATHARSGAVRPNKCPAWSTWKVLTDVLVNICGSCTFLADRSGKASRAHSQHVGSWTRHPASGVRAAYPNVESPRPAWPAHCSRYAAHFTAPLDRCSR